MARTQTLLQLRTRARQFCGMENSLFITDAELTGYLNQSICDLESQLEAAGAFARKPQSSAITCTAGTETVSTPSSTLAVYGVDLSVDSTTRTLERIEFDERNMFREWSVPTNGTPAFFRVDGTNIHLYPTPNRAYTGTVYYYKAHVDLSADGDTYDGVNGWDNYAVWSAVAIMLAKQEGDPQFAMSERGRWLQTILTGATRLDTSRSPTVTNAYRRKRRVRNECP